MYNPWEFPSSPRWISWAVILLWSDLTWFKVQLLSVLSSTCKGWENSLPSLALPQLYPVCSASLILFWASGTSSMLSSMEICVRSRVSREVKARKLPGPSVCEIYRRSGCWMQSIFFSWGNVEDLPFGASIPLRSSPHRIWTDSMHCPCKSFELHGKQSFPLSWCVYPPRVSNLRAACFFGFLRWARYQLSVSHICR